MKISWGAVLGSGPLKACVFVNQEFFTGVEQSVLQVPWWCVRECWLWIPEVSAQARVAGTASWKRPVPLTSHKIQAFYLVQLVIFIYRPRGSCCNTGEHSIQNDRRVWTKTLCPVLESIWTLWTALVWNSVILMDSLILKISLLKLEGSLYSFCSDLRLSFPLWDVYY